MYGIAATNCGTKYVSFETKSQKFYPDLELLSNGADFYTNPVFYDIRETEEKDRCKKGKTLCNYEYKIA